MAPTFNKGDRVRLKATLFDNGKRDRNGLLFSEDWLAKGNGEWCYGTVSFVYVKKGRQAQKYRMKYDGGQTMTSMEEQMELAGVEEENSDESSAVDDMEGSDYEASDGSTVELERDVGVRTERDTPADQDPEEEAGNVTDDSEGENGEDRQMTLTAWTCSVHNKIYACKNKNCWQDHLSEVQRLKQTEFEI